MELDFYMDGGLTKRLDQVKKNIRRDDDAVIVVDGRERIGKSVMAMQIGWYLSDGKLKLADVCFTPIEFEERVEQAEPHSVIIFDEAYMGLASGDHQKEYNKRLIKLLVMVGQKNLCIILVIPSVFTLRSYVPLHRGIGLIHCMKDKDGRRGLFHGYDANTMSSLYICGKKYYSYIRPKRNFFGRFSNKFVLDEKAYRAKKLKSLNEFLSLEDKKDSNYKSDNLYRAIQYIKQIKPKIKSVDLAKDLKLHPRTISKALNRRFSEE